MNILIADSDLFSNKTIRGFCNKKQINVLLANNLTITLDIVADFKPEIIIVNEEIIGQENFFFKQIKKFYNFPPYLILSAYCCSSEKVSHFLNNGGSTYIIKTLDPNLFMATLNVAYKSINYHIESLNKQSKLLKLSLIDDLTEIDNRRSFDIYYKREWERAVRESYSLIIAIADIDNFKEFNDLYGHIPGDMCLHTIAKTIKSCLKRPSDCLFRYGGEEFAIILSNTNDPKNILEQIRESIMQLNIKHHDSHFNKVTISIGAISIFPNQVNLDRTCCLSLADKALYKAKERRNSVIVDNLKTVHN